jgi:hypothetical protein
MSILDDFDEIDRIIAELDEWEFMPVDMLDLIDSNEFVDQFDPVSTESESEDATEV